MIIGREYRPAGSGEPRGAPLPAVVFAGQSMPVFWMGIMLNLLFSLILQLLPASGYGWPNVTMPASSPC